MHSPNTPSVAVLGAGISGLSTAYALQKKGVPVTVYEKGDQPGGVVQTERHGEWLVEKGPNTLLVRDQKLWDLLDELDLAGELTEPGPEAKKRYIVRDGQPCPLPMSIGDFLKTNLFSTSAKLRLLKEPFVKAPTVGDEPLARFIERRLGQEILDYAVNPFVSGIYAGDPKHLSVKHTFGSLFKMEQSHGSIAKGYFKREKKAANPRRTLASFTDGLQALPTALASPLGEQLKLGTTAQEVQQTDTGWAVKTADGTRAHAAVVSTIPAHQLSKLGVGRLSSGGIAPLHDVPYVPVSGLALGFRRDQVTHPLDGFGMLIPEREQCSLLGCLFSSTLFESRAPDDHVLLSCFIGGARQPGLASQPTEQLIEAVTSDLNRLLGVKGAPVFHRHTFWSHAIPQYTVGYDTVLQTIEQIEASNPGLFLTGNIREGVSVPDCIINGFMLADSVQRFIAKSR